MKTTFKNFEIEAKKVEKMNKEEFNKALTTNVNEILYNIVIINTDTKNKITFKTWKMFEIKNESDLIKEFYNFATNILNPEEIANAEEFGISKEECKKSIKNAKLLNKIFTGDVYELFEEI
jgi:hypothetical protein